MSVANVTSASLNLLPSEAVRVSGVGSSSLPHAVSRARANTTVNNAASFLIIDAPCWSVGKRDGHAKDSTAPGAQSSRAPISSVGPTVCRCKEDLDRARRLAGSGPTLEHVLEGRPIRGVARAGAAAA